MAFKNPKQREAFFAQQKAKSAGGFAPKSGVTNPAGSPDRMMMNVQPTNAMPANPTPQPVRVIGLPKVRQFPRIRRYFKV